MHPTEGSSRPRRRGTRRARNLILAGLFALLGLACSRPAGDRPGAVVLVVIDTLRGDRLGCTGYADAVTPHLDSLAARGVLFRAARTAAPVTLPAVSTLLTGRYPVRHGVRDNDRFVLGEAEETLAERFRASGWRTGAVLGSAVLAADRGLAAGFEVYDDDFQGPYPIYRPDLDHMAEEFARTRRRGSAVTDRALGLARDFGDDRFFLLVHYFDVHDPYDAPPDVRRLHPDRPYDAGVTVADAEVGRLVDGLAGRDDVLFVVVSDHGESLGEHGEYGHGFLVHETTLRVPMIVAGPGVPAGLRRDDPVGLDDVEPTLASLCRLRGGDAPRDGIVLDWSAPATAPRHHYAETLRPLVSYEWSELTALHHGSAKIIRSREGIETYDLAADPGETRDLGTTPATAALLGALNGITAGDDPEAVFAQARNRPDPARAELLESLGYVGRETGSPSSARPHPRRELSQWRDVQWSKKFLREAADWVEAGDLTLAETILDSTLVLNPGLPDAWYLRGRVREESGRADAAATDYAEAIRLEPRHVEALAASAIAAEREGRDARARDLWRRVQTVDPEHVGALRFLSGWHLEHGALDSAVVELKTLARITPDDAGVHFNLGLACQRAGLTEDAMESFEEFVRLKPDDPRAAEVQQWLRTASEPGTD